MDGLFGNMKQFLKPRHVRKDSVMEYVREYQFWHITKETDRLAALGDACRECCGS